MTMPMLDRRLIRNFDYFLLVVLLAICALGTIILYSTARGLDGSVEALHFMQRQAIFLGAGFFLMFMICFIDYINFVNWARYLYLASLFLLALVLIPGVGQTEYGATRWISIGFFNLQPSEVAKIALIIFLAKVLSEKEGPFDGFKDLMPSLAATAAPMALIFLQPDLGTALVFAAVLLGMLYAAGVDGRYLAALIGAGVAAVPLFWFFLLKDYQKMRLMVFINPDMDPIQYGYQLLQSMIGIGSGGLSGKGLFESTQVRLKFLPFPKTDFIFSVLGEELGFAGAVGLLALFFLLIYRILWIGTHSKDKFGFLFCIGTAVLLTFQILVNIGMTIGVMPITGIPLPFISYGNNALLVNMMAIGLVLNVGMRRHKIQF